MLQNCLLFVLQKYPKIGLARVKIERFLALLSISLGVLNLMPIPVLDGGHLLYYTIEAVIRRPVPEKIQEWGLQLGLLMISGIMMLAIYNDVNRFL